MKQIYAHARNKGEVNALASVSHLNKKKLGLPDLHTKIRCNSYMSLISKKKRYHKKAESINHL